MRSRSRWLAAVLVLTAVAAVLRFWRIGHQGFWYDEADTALLMHFSAGRMLGLIPKLESTPPLYYCVAWVWSHIFGSRETPLRSLSALAGVLTVPVIYLAAARLTRSRPSALAAATLAAFNPLLIWYSQEARAYELLVLLCAAAWLAFACALDGAARGWLAAWALCGALALTTEYYAVIVVAPQAVVLLWRWRRRPAVLAAVALDAVVGLALLPLLITQNHTGNDRWIKGIPLGMRVGQLLPQFMLGPEWPARLALTIVGCLLGGAGLLALAWRRPARGVLVFVMTLAGFLLTLLFIAAGSDTLLTRNLIGLWPGTAIAVSAGLVAVSPAGLAAAAPAGRSAVRWVTARRALGPAVISGLCVAGLIAAIGVATTYSLQRPNWRPLAARLEGQRLASGRRLILLQQYGRALPLSLYMRGLGHAPGHTYADVGVLEVIAIGPEAGPSDCWWGAGCNLSPSSLQARYPIPGFRATGVSHVEQFSVMTLVASHPETVTRAELRQSLVDRTLHGDAVLLQPARAA